MVALTCEWVHPSPVGSQQTPSSEIATLASDSSSHWISKHYPLEWWAMLPLTPFSFFNWLRHKRTSPIRMTHVNLQHKRLRCSHFCNFVFYGIEFVPLHFLKKVAQFSHEPTLGAKSVGTRRGNQELVKINKVCVIASTGEASSAAEEVASKQQPQPMKPYQFLLSWHVIRLRDVWECLSVYSSKVGVAQYSIYTTSMKPTSLLKI